MNAFASLTSRAHLATGSSNKLRNRSPALDSFFLAFSTVFFTASFARFHSEGRLPRSSSLSPPFRHPGLALAFAGLTMNRRASMTAAVILFSQLRPASWRCCSASVDGMTNTP